ncbi:MAG: lysylphosphatidylglycerol synthase transmembrane domain-containing protein [Bifidobacterium sp.]|nr:lysylphosphatidylglycerol synthase transmembrane domain-containing protein [Bifidobacterium sp.]
MSTKRDADGAAATAACPAEPSPHDDVLVADIAPRRTHVFADLFHAGVALVVGVVVLLFAIYLRGVTSGVESDARSAADALDWLLDVPASLLQQLVVLIVTVIVLVQLIVNKAWLQTAWSVGALLLGFAGAWGVSLLLTQTGNPLIISALRTAGTQPGASLLPDFYAPLSAFLTMAGPRRMRSAVKWGWNILAVGAVILIIGSWNSVIGVVVSVCIGRIVGLVIRFAVGTSNSGAWGEQVVQALRTIGLEPRSLRRAHHDDAEGVLYASLADDLVENSRMYDLEDQEGHRYVVSVLDNQVHLTGYFSQMWQLIRLNGVAVRHDRSAISATHHHYEMANGLLSIGLPAPRAYGVADVEESSILVLDADEPPLACSPKELDDRLAEGYLRYLGRAHERGFTHRHITADTLALTPQGEPFLAGWQNGDYASSSANISLDKVQMLALFATAIGVDRTVAAAVRAWGDDTVINLIPFVQKVAVPASTRDLEGWDKQLLENLRKAMGALAPEEVSESLEQVTLSRFSLRSFFALALLVVAVAVVFTQLNPTEMVKAVKDANLWMGLVCLVFSFLAWVGSAWALGAFMDRDKRSMIGLLCSQMAAGFTAVSMPAGIGPAFVNLQYLRKSGYRNTVATAIMSAVLAVQAVITVVLLIIIGIFTGKNTLSGMIPTNTLILVIAAVALVVSVAMAIPPVRKKVTDTYLPLVKSYARSLLETLTQPKQLMGSVAGSLLLNLSTGFGFWAALLAFGYWMNPIEVTFIFLLANTLGSAVPTPGGLGAVEAALSVAFTAVGVPSTIAVSATLVYRIAFYWLRIPVGALAMQWLNRHDLI